MLRTVRVAPSQAIAKVARWACAWCVLCIVRAEGGRDFHTRHDTTCHMGAMGHDMGHVPWLQRISTARAPWYFLQDAMMMNYSCEPPPC